MTKPLQATSNLIGTKFLPTFVINGVREFSDEGLQQSAEWYAAYFFVQK